MTLVGGLASTVFIPFNHVLIEALGWRPALVVLAVINLVRLRRHSACVIPADQRRAKANPARGSAGATPGGHRRVLKRLPFWGFVATALLHGACSQVLPASHSACSWNGALSSKRPLPRSRLSAGASRRPGGDRARRARPDHAGHRACHHGASRRAFGFSTSSGPGSGLVVAFATFTALPTA